MAAATVEGGAVAVEPAALKAVVGMAAVASGSVARMSAARAVPVAI